MKTTLKIIYVLKNKNGESEYDTYEKAREMKEVVKDVYAEYFEDDKDLRIEVREKEFYEIEKGDKVYFRDNDGKPKKDRIDEITKIGKNIFGDTAYYTKELNGNKIGCTTEKWICLVDIADKKLTGNKSK